MAETTVEERLRTIPRGRALRGPPAIAEFIWNDPAMARAVYRLPRGEYGLVILAGTITGFTGWLEAALARDAGRKKIPVSYVDSLASKAGATENPPAS